MKPKFRAWKHRESPEMINDIDFIDWKNGIVGFPYQLSRDTFREDEENINNMILMQYTGLKDKNGVEIYEGDIVREKNADDEGIVVEVVWQKCAFYGRENGFEPEYLVADFLEGEVIGNRFENPELLEELEE